MKTLLYYWLLQIPGLMVVGLVSAVLVTFEWISVLTAMGIGAAWLIKDAIMYPFVKRAFEPTNPGDSGPAGLVGRIGTTTRELAPAGFIRVRGELWQAEHVESDQSLPADCAVQIVEARGMVLIVRRPQQPTETSQ